jgi:hypothetical protein
MLATRVGFERSYMVWTIVTLLLLQITRNNLSVRFPVPLFTCLCFEGLFLLNSDLVEFSSLPISTELHGAEPFL